MTAEPRRPLPPRGRSAARTPSAGSSTRPGVSPATRGLTGWTLRELGAEVGMRAPSLYEYPASKNALFDLMFADGYRQLAERIDALDRTGEPRAALRRGAQLYVGSPPRTLSGSSSVPVHRARLRPSADSMALARRCSTS